MTTETDSSELCSAHTDMKHRFPDGGTCLCGLCKRCGNRWGNVHICYPKRDSSERAKPDVLKVLSMADDYAGGHLNTENYRQGIRADLEQAAIAACEAWAAQWKDKYDALDEADRKYVGTLITERDKAQMFAEMNANLSAGHCRRMHIAEDERDAAQQDADALAEALRYCCDSILSRGQPFDAAEWAQLAVERGKRGQTALAAHDARQA